MGLGQWMIFLSLLAAGGWLLGHAAWRSWRRPERFDASWVWKRPGDVAPTGPEEYWQPARTEAGAVDGWSPGAETLAAERDRAVLDDVDEWLAEHVRAFERALAEIESAPRGIDGERSPLGWSVAMELDAFQRGSMGLHAYRAMILGSSREFTMRESMELEQLLSA